MIRRALFWIHLMAGVVAGLIILVMSFTGVLLAYERQLVAWSERGYHATPQEMEGERLPVQGLLERLMVKSGREEPPTNFVLTREPSAPVAFAWGRDGSVYVNPYTGEVKGSGSALRAFMREVVVWHRWLGNREHGRNVTGAANLAFIVLILTGIVIWCPRRMPWRWTWRGFRAGYRLNLRLKGAARDWNWHTVVGIWCAPFLLFLSVTGTIWSYKWSHDLIYTLSGTPVPEGSRRAPGGGGGPKREAKPLAQAPLEPYLEAAKEVLPTWQTISLSLPEKGGQAVSLTLSERLQWHPYARSSLKLAPATAAVVEWKPFMEQNLGARIRGTMRPLHTGEAGGLLGQTLAALASAGAVVLVWTGLALTWRRLFGRGRKKRAASADVQKTASER